MIKYFLEGEGGHQKMTVRGGRPWEKVRIEGTGHGYSYWGFKKSHQLP